MHLLGLEGKKLRAAGRSPFTLLTLGVIVLVLVGAYQVRIPQHIEAEEPALETFLDGFHSTEPGPGFSYHWTPGEASMRLRHALLPPPVILRLRLASGGPAESSTLHIALGDTPLPPISVQPAFATYELVVWSPQQADDLVLHLSSIPFYAPEDRRPLGILVDWVEVRSLGTAPIVPPLAVLLPLVLLLGLVYLIVLHLTSSCRVAAAFTCLVTLGTAWPIIHARPRFDETFVPAGIILGIDYLLVILSQCLIGAARQHWHLTIRSWERVGLIALVLLSFTLTAAGLLNPYQPALPKSYDLSIHVPALVSTTAGRLFFLSYTLSGRFGEAAGLPFPYPPAMYVLLAPTTLVLHHQLALIIGTLVLRALGNMLMYLAVKKASGNGLAALLAAATYTVLPVAQLILWWGQFSNDFGQWTLLLLWTVGIVVPLRPSNYTAWYALGIVFCLLFLSHIGVLVLSGVFICLYIGLKLLRRDREWIRLAAVLGASSALTIALYYSYFLSILYQSGQSRFSSEGGTTPFTWPSFARLLGGYLYSDYRWFPVIMAGLALVAVLLNKGLSGRMEQMALPWLATFAVLALGHLWMGFALGRYVIFLVPPVCSYAGLFLARIWQRYRWGKVLAICLLAFLLFESLVILLRAYFLNQTPSLYL